MDTIIVSNLQKSFKNLKVLDGISFTVGKGSILALLGPNGAGKTTTVRILATLLKHDQGKVVVNGYDVLERPKDVRSSIGLTGQFAAVDEYLKGDENLRMIGRLYRMPKDEIEMRTTELLRLFDLNNSRPVKHYSGGMKRKLDLAMSLISTPPILFLDEPTTGLDPPSRLALWENIRSLAAKGTTVLLTTQNMEEADKLADKILVIDKGKIIAEGTPDQLKSKVGNERIVLIVAQGFEKALQIIGGRVMQHDRRSRMISIRAEGVRALQGLLGELSEVEIEKISLQQPTLDDVFLTLTGHTTEVKNGK